MARRKKHGRRRARPPAPPQPPAAPANGAGRGARRWLLVAGLAICVLLAALVGYLITHPGQPDRSPPAPAAPPQLVQSAPLPTATYVGGETCGQCHAGEATAWRTSHHALAMQHASAETMLGDFNDATVTHGGVTSRFFRQGGKFMVHTDGPDGALHDYAIDFTFGVAPLQQYLVAFPDGRLQALPLAWDTRPKAEGGQRWFHLYPNETIAAGDPLHWTGLQQNWNYMCAECHSTNLRRNYDAQAKRYATTWSEINVSCEACHGPGSQHIAWAKREAGWEKIDAQSKGLAVILDERHGVTWTLDPQTGNSTRSRPRDTMHEIEACVLCHSRRAQIWDAVTPGAPIGDSHRVALLDNGLYFPDGQIHDEVYEYGSFRQSRMFQAGVTCSDCHEPHSLALRAPGNGVCLQCHASEKYAA
ncbi:MAG TPA: cytochrome c3 family protein, partial [Dongiaceae bacterium]|nr:cytochrome c3 family protein [Dongiaceae bacterium]